MSAPGPVADLDESMRDWIRDITGALRIHATRQSAGASRAGYAIDAELADGSTTALWLRADTGVGPQSSGPYTLRREAAIYRSLEGRGVKVARVAAVHPTEEAFLMERLYGRNWFSEIDDPRRAETVATRFMEQLAALHRLDVRTLDLDALGPVRTVREHILDELDIWDGQYRSHADDDPEPVLEAALAWLRRNVPDDDGWPVVLVQGDTGPGNFMFDADDVVAVTDWEIAHFGDLHDDLAWVYVRDAQERFTNLVDRLADYERASGYRVDPRRLRYFVVLAQTRCAIGSRNGLLARDSGGETANHLIYSTMHLRLVAEALARAVGMQPEQPDPIPDTGDTSTTWVHDVVIADLARVVLPAITDGFAARRAKGIARLVKYLREADRLGAAAEEQELRDLRSLFGHTPADAHTGRLEICARIAAGDVDESDAVTYGLRRAARETQILRPAMGSLADRHHSPLPG